MTTTNSSPSIETKEVPLPFGPPMFSAGETIGQYTIIELLAQGGMGDIYLASDLVLDRLVAIKCLSARLASDKSFIDRFYKEAKATASVVHNNVVAIHDLSMKDTIPYFVMEYIEGETLSQRIRRLSRLTPSEALPIIKQAALGLEAAFESGLIHRDVKPSNIIINGKGIAKLTDFGLVMDLEESNRITHSDMILGSPHYISPEQARGESDIDFRSDIYSLGISLYHALAGKLPFNASTPMGIMLRHVNDPLPPLDKEVPTLDISIVSLVHKMVEKDRKKRFQSYGNLIEALNDALSGFGSRSTDPASGSLPTLTDAQKSKTDFSEIHSAPTLAGISSSQVAGTNTKESTSSDAHQSSSQALTQKKKLPIPLGYDLLGGFLRTIILVYSKPREAFERLAKGKLDLKRPFSVALLCLLMLMAIIPLGREPQSVILWKTGFVVFLLTDLILILPIYVLAQSKRSWKSAFKRAFNLICLSWISQIWFSARWLFFLAFPTPWIAYCGMEKLLNIEQSRIKMTWLLCLILFILRVLIAFAAARYARFIFAINT